LHQLYIDFSKAYDSFRREVMYSILTEFGIPMELVKIFKWQAAHEHCIGRPGSINWYSFLNNGRFIYCSFKAYDDDDAANRYTSLFFQLY
jgi:hypothetical protein